MLLQVVVDSDDVGLQLVRLLQKAGRGRVTFMPLNRLQVPDVQYPKQWGRDVEPLYKHLRTEEKYAKAVRQVGSAACTLHSCLKCTLFPCSAVGCIAAAKCVVSSADMPDGTVCRCLGGLWCARTVV